MTRYCLAFALPLAALALPGCGSDKPATDDPNSIAFNDYESVMGWQPDANAVTREQAHSGKYSVVVNGGKEFAMGYTLPIGKATARRPHTLEIKGWAFMTDAKSTARLGLLVREPGTNKEIYGDGIDFKDAVKESKKWVEISKQITLPATISSNQELCVFLWRGNAGSPAYLDDLSIKLVD